MKSQQSLKLRILDYVFLRFFKMPLQKNVKSRFFWIFKNVKNVFSNYDNYVIYLRQGDMVLLVDLLLDFFTGSFVCLSVMTFFTKYKADLHENLHRCSEP